MYLDSPFERCPCCGEYVLLDQTQGECAHEHGCPQMQCPLASCFSGTEFHDDEDGAAPPERSD